MVDRADIWAQKIGKALKSSKQLSTLVGIAERVREITSNQDASIKELSRVISADAVMTAKVLRLVNSAAYGFSGRISNIDQAIVILGFTQLRSLCIGLTLIHDLGNESQCKEFDRSSVWRHSLATAVGSKLIQERVGGDSADIFVAGLLSNIGRIVLDQYFAEDFRKVLAYSHEQKIPLIAAERHVLDITHAEIGYHAAKVWCLDERLAAAIRDHHGPSTNHNAAIVNVAYVIAQARGIGNPGDSLLTMLSNGVLAQLKIDEWCLRSLLRDLDAEFKLIEPLLLIMSD